ncbi:ImmA/IrrE family metallo-endopeptidase [Vibrio sp. PID17_43]|uniref:ImmA/IrrE family metallo-endopeptidase n=1 Tax=Vibrio sp. PID17_43 TaxID=1583451 RepID=UPI000BFF8C4F|nr:ImmA/IrrE family metallo-endopeptidase [Vibrio sp. PID17_43]
MKTVAIKQKHKSTFDELVDLTRGYRSSSSYFQFIQFVAKIKNYSAYNVALIYSQNPNVTYVASKADWSKRHNRTVNKDARPLIILAPFHPVMFVFDVNDTEGAPLPDRVFAPFWAKGNTPEHAVAKLHKLAKRLSVIIHEEPRSATSAGCIKTNYIENEFKSYILEINSNHAPQVRFATLVHELAHLMCGHLGIHNVNESWKERTNLSLDQREFEAESVSYIICKRFGIRSNSEEYLSGYVKCKDFIPDISIDTVLHVAGTIENAINGQLPNEKRNDSTGQEQLALF